MKGHTCTGSDGVLFCAGTFRGDSTYGPGNNSTTSSQKLAIDH